MGDDPNPHPGVGQPPEHLRAAVERPQVPQHPLLGDGETVEPLELGVVEAPLGETPRPLDRQVVGVDAAFGGDDLAETVGVVGAHPVEVDAEHECTTAHRRDPIRAVGAHDSSGATLRRG